MNGTKPLPIKHHSLTGRITIELMHDAFRAVKKNRGAAGVDRQSIKMFENNLEQNLEALMRQLKGRMFRPQPARRTYIDKGGGKKRPLGIPTSPGNRTRLQRAFGLGGDHTSVSSTSWETLSRSKVALRSRR